MAKNNRSGGRYRVKGKPDGKVLSVIIWFLVGVMLGIGFTVGGYYLFGVLPTASEAVNATVIRFDTYKIIF